MPDNKRQHYVPKSILKYFSCDTEQRQINIINAKSGKIIWKASLKDQFYRNYFYGKNLDIEHSLSQFEGVFSKILIKVITTNHIDLIDHFNIAMMIVLQKARTLNAERQVNYMVDKIAKFMMINRLDEKVLRNIRIGIKDAPVLNIGAALSHGAITYDLKQFLVVNRSKVPFIIGDNPVAETNWFGRDRYSGRALTGIASAGLQMIMPISPKHALMLHDSNIYITDSPDNVITIRSDQTAINLNELQWLNAYKNVYFSAALNDNQIKEILKSVRRDDSLPSFQRLEKVPETHFYRPNNKDEFSGPNEGITSELIHFTSMKLPKDIRLKQVRIRPKPRFYDNGSMAGPIRDPVWCKIVEDFVTAVEDQEYLFKDFWEFAERHYLAPQVGSWLGRIAKLHLLRSKFES